MGVGVRHYDAFSAVPGMGNPAGVVLGGEYPAEVMQAVTRRVGFNETVFVTAVRPGAVALRYFTPGHEVELCGHATVVAFVALNDRGLLAPHAVSLRDLLAENGAEAPSSEPRRRRIYERFGVCDNPFPASNHSRNLPHQEGEADREIAARFKVFQRPPHQSQVLLILGTQGVGKTNMLDWYERQFADYLGGSEGYAIIRYYPDPDPSFDMILPRQIRCSRIIQWPRHIGLPDARSS